MRVVRYWYRLPKEAVNAPFLEVSAARLDRASGRDWGKEMRPCPWQGVRLDKLLGASSTNGSVPGWNVNPRLLWHGLTRRGGSFAIHPQALLVGSTAQTVLRLPPCFRQKQACATGSTSAFLRF